MEGSEGFGPDINNGSLEGRTFDLNISVEARSAVGEAV